MRVGIWLSSFVSIFCAVVYFTTLNKYMPKWDCSFKAWWLVKVVKVRKVRYA